jgi:hypothetical protein
VNTITHTDKCSTVQYNKALSFVKIKRSLSSASTHRHSGIQHLGPDWLLTFRLPDCFRHRHFSFRYRKDQIPDSQAFWHKKTVQRRKETPCTSTMLAVWGHTSSTFYTAGGGKGYTLHVHTAGGTFRGLPS